MSWVHDAPVGQALRGESDSGRPFVALKISAGTAAHNPGTWNTSEGPATDTVVASGRNLVRLQPDDSMAAEETPAGTVRIKARPTVADIIELLESFPPEAEVWMDVDQHLDRPHRAYLDDDGDLIVLGRAS